MTNLKWLIGEIEIFQIVEIEVGEVIQNIIPNAIRGRLRSKIVRAYSGFCRWEWKTECCSSMLFSQVERKEHTN